MRKVFSEKALALAKLIRDSGVAFTPVIVNSISFYTTKKSQLMLVNSVNGILNVHIETFEGRPPPAFLLLHKSLMITIQTPFFSKLLIVIQGYVHNIYKTLSIVFSVMIIYITSRLSTI